MNFQSESVEFWNKRAKSFVSPVSSGVYYDKNTSELAHFLETQRLLSVLKFKKNMRVLDVGAGVGRWSIEFSKYVKEVVAIEPAENLFKILKANCRNFPNIICKQEKIENFNPNGYFDVIIFSAVLSYLSDEQVEKSLAKARKILKDNAYIVIREFVSKKEKRRTYSEGLIEYSRPESFYKNLSLNNHLYIERSFYSHIPFILFNLARRFKRVQPALHFFYNKRFYYGFLIWNKILGSVLGCILYLLNVTRMKIYILRALK